MRRRAEVAVHVSSCMRGRLRAAARAPPSTLPLSLSLPQSRPYPLSDAERLAIPLPNPYCMRLLEGVRHLRAPRRQTRIWALDQPFSRDQSGPASTLNRTLIARSG